VETTPWDRVAARTNTLASPYSPATTQPVQPDTISHWLAEIGVNVRKFGDSCLERFDVKPDRDAWQAAERVAEAFLRGERPSLYLYSERPGDRLAAGCGKTHLAVGIIRRILEKSPHRKADIRFAYVPEIVDDYRRQFDEAARPENLDAKYIWPELLVMDDFGAQRLTEYAVEILNRIIYRREGRTTIYTSNLPLHGIDAKDSSGYIERATSRIAGECTIICMRGPDRRLMPKAV
jgi:DNA replication protein DnaC